MDVASLLKQGKITRFSLETYPPKTSSGKGEPTLQEHLSKIFDTVEHLLPYKPLFVSVTYNPEGKTKSTSIPIASIIKQRFGIEALAHLTSLGIPRDEIPRTLDVLDYFDIHNVLALRGDLPKNRECEAGAMIHASDMVALIRKHRKDFCIAVAAYPEGHPECVDEKGARDLKKDLSYLKAKVERGAGFAITQLFMDNSKFFDFVDRAQKAGIDIPIIPGIMPLINYRNIRIVKSMTGATIPDSLVNKIECKKDDPAEIIEIGIEHAISQCKGLMDRVPCIHFYAMNMWEPTERIIKALL
jgi:methylenetetrahydrofolate reductase (NADPH)